MFAIVSVLCISIGAGAVTTIFSAMNALVLRPLPGAADASRLVRIERERPGGNDGVSASYVFYDRLRTRTVASTVSPRGGTDDSPFGRRVTTPARCMADS